MTQLSDYKVTRTGASKNTVAEWSAKYNNLLDYLGGASKYIVDSTATDQGAASATGDRTIKDFVDTIENDTATIIIPHSSTGATTTFTLTTSETIPANITLLVEPGAIIDGAGTLTINGQVQAGPVQIFGTTLTVAGLKWMWSEWFGTASAALKTAEAALATNGGTINVQTDMTIEADDEVVFDKAGTTVVAHGDIELTYTGSATCITINANNITWGNFYIRRSTCTWTDGVSDTVSTALLVQDACYCDVVAWTANTVIGLRLKGTDAGSNGCCHNIIRIKLLYNHRYNMSFAIDGSGWTNANTVIGGLLSNSSTVDEAAAGVGSVTCYRIHSLGGGDNRLFGVRLETLVGDDSDIMAIYVATGNLMMYGSSFEWDAYDGTYAPIYFHTDAVGVKILAAQFATDGGSYRISDFVQDLGSANEVHGRDERYELGGWYRAAPTVSNATADPVVLWAMAVPDDCVIQVNAIVSGRKSDNSEYVQLRMTAIGKAASGTATLGDSDVTELNNVGAVVVDDCVFDASGDTIRLKVGGNDVGETDTYYFSAMVEWQIVST